MGLLPGRRRLIAHHPEVQQGRLQWHFFSLKEKDDGTVLDQLHPVVSGQVRPLEHIEEVEATELAYRDLINFLGNVVGRWTLLLLGLATPG